MVSFSLRLPISYLLPTGLLSGVLSFDSIRSPISCLKHLASDAWLMADSDSINRATRENFFQSGRMLIEFPRLQAAGDSVVWL